MEEVQKPRNSMCNTAKLLKMSSLPQKEKFHIQHKPVFIANDNLLGENASSSSSISVL
jgi:hypothetical protein